MNYNTQAKRIKLPEYGRNIQNMVDYCLTIEDRDERLKCAESIVRTMSSFFPNQKERSDYMQVLWDHLYIISGYKLDVDFPYEVSKAKQFDTPLHSTLPTHRSTPPRYRHYGHSIQRMIEVVRAMPQGKERNRAACLIAMQMKRDYIVWNKDNVANTRIFTDLYEMSCGEIYLDEFTCLLPEPKELLAASAQPITQSHKRKTNSNRKRRR